MAERFRQSLSARVRDYAYLVAMRALALVIGSVVVNLSLMYGCHVAGHFAAGMFGTITVTPS